MQLPQVILRTIQFLLTLITMALLGNVIADAFSGNPSSVNFSIFVTVLAMLVVLYGLAASFVEALAVPMILGVADAIATLFTFIAGVLLAAKLGVHSCGNEVIDSSRTFGESRSNSFTVLS